MSVAGVAITAITSVASKIGCTAQTVSEWIKRTEIDAGKPAGLPIAPSTDHDHRAKRVERELREYVQERLAGRIATPDGKKIAGPSVAWKGRRAGPRQDRRWARAWSPEQIARRLRLGFPGGQEHARQP